MVSMKKSINFILAVFLVAIAIAFMPSLIDAVAHLVGQTINSAAEGMRNLLSPLHTSSGNRLEGVIRLGLYFIVGVFILKWLVKRWREKG